MTSAALPIPSPADTLIVPEARREGVRTLMVPVFISTVLHPSSDHAMVQAVEVLDAADLVSDPGRLGEIARGMLARPVSP